MKSEKRNCRKELNYPRLMKSKFTDGIYLMTSDKEGTCVHNSGHSCCADLGEHCMNLTALVDYCGEICLSND